MSLLFRHTVSHLYRAFSRGSAKVHCRVPHALTQGFEAFHPDNPGDQILTPYGGLVFSESRLSLSLRIPLHGVIACRGHTARTQRYLTVPVLRDGLFCPLTLVTSDPPVCPPDSLATLVTTPVAPDYFESRLLPQGPGYVVDPNDEPWDAERFGRNDFLLTTLKARLRVVHFFLQQVAPSTSDIIQPLDAPGESGWRARITLNHFRHLPTVPHYLEDRLRGRLPTFQDTFIARALEDILPHCPWDSAHGPYDADPEECTTLSALQDVIAEEMKLCLMDRLWGFYSLLRGPSVPGVFDPCTFTPSPGVIPVTSRLTVSAPHASA